MSNAKTKYDFAIGFFTILSINISAFAATFILFVFTESIYEFLDRYPILKQLFDIVAFCIISELMLFGLFQFFYVAPMTIEQSKKGNRKMTKGMIFGALFSLGMNCAWLIVVINVYSKLL